MKRKIDPRHVEFAKGLRRNQTQAEQILWNKLRHLQLDGVKFRRQHPIGGYIVDFVSLDKKLIIEIDGGQHNIMPIEEKDANRTKWLNGEDYRILRFWNNDILNNIEGVIFRIRACLR